MREVLVRHYVFVHPRFVKPMFFRLWVVFVLFSGYFCWLFLHRRLLYCGMKYVLKNASLSWTLMDCNCFSMALSDCALMMVSDR